MFEPLKNFFETASSCPVSVRRFFDDNSALFWLHFIDSQLQLSNDSILKTETKHIAAFEVAAEISELRKKIEHRKKVLYIPNACTMYEQFTEVEKEVVKLYAEKFYSTLSNYLEKWSKSLDGAEVFGWMALTIVPDWEKDIKPSLLYASKRIGNEKIDADKVFDETNLLQQITTAKLESWTSIAASSQARWLDVFKTLNQQNRPIQNTSLLVQYAFAIPGSSTEAERLFSIINDVWGPDKEHMSLLTLEAYLNIKVNSEMNCTEYYESAKKNDDLLAQVQSSQKYQSHTNE